MTLLTVIIAVGVYAILGVVVWIALQLRGRGSRHEMLIPPEVTHPHYGGPWLGHFAVWEWREERWLVVSGNLPAGIEPGPAPGYPGAFEGESIKTWVRPR